MINGKPKWKHAPDWANYLAKDADGNWYWYSDKPILVIDDNQWEKRLCSDRMEQAFVVEEPQWYDSLKQRPKKYQKEI